MTTVFEQGKVLFIGDSCDRTEEFDAPFQPRRNGAMSPMMLAWAVLKNHGWQARKVAGDWQHGCEQCGIGLSRTNAPRVAEQQCARAWLIRPDKHHHAHIWLGDDTACRMYSTGGLNKRRMTVTDDIGDRPICSMCAARAGVD